MIIVSLMGAASSFVYCFYYGNDLSHWYLSSLSRPRQDPAGAHTVQPADLRLFYYGGVYFDVNCFCLQHPMIIRLFFIMIEFIFMFIVSVIFLRATFFHFSFGYFFVDVDFYSLFISLFVLFILFYFIFILFYLF